MAKVVMVEVVEEDKEGERTVKRLSGEDAEKWMEVAIEGIVMLSRRASIQGHVGGKYDSLGIIEWEERFK